MRSNLAVKYTAETHGGSKASLHITAEQQLRRSVMSCLLWEKEFYQDGMSIADQIADAANKVTAEVLATVAIEARNKYHMRHVPLLLLVLLAKRGGRIVGDTMVQVIQRADELSEFLALYWKGGKQPLSKQVKLGLARAFRKFDAYALAKYNRDGAIKMRDVLFMCHAKPLDDAQAALWKLLIDGKLPAAGTWEEELSAGKDKRATWTRLLTEEKIGYLALLRNLRNMTEVGVDSDLIKTALLARKGAGRVLPFRYIAAARACPQLESTIDQAFLASFASVQKLSGKTGLIIDISGSMSAALSGKSDMRRIDAACALGAVVRELCDEPVIFATAGNDHRRIHATAIVPDRRGVALAEAIQGMDRQLGGGGIFLKQVMDFVQSKVSDLDRVIVITDEQDCGIGSEDSPLKAKIIGEHNYMINVASNKNGVGYGAWNHIDGFSENVIRWIFELENDAGRTQ